jgi:hypothetical protein
MGTATAERITVAGQYDIPADVYHRDPVTGSSLSSSGARALLPPSCPARFRYDRDHPRETSTKAFDLGHAAHRAVLGAGADFLVVDAADWRTNAAKEQRAEAYATGRTPLLADEYEQVRAMVVALTAHPYAAALFRPGTGHPEQTLVWRNDSVGIWCRAMLDWLPNARPGRRMVVPDYKTAAAVDRASLARAVASHGYHQQAAHNLDGVVALGLADDPAFVFVCQEKTPPYLVTVIQLDPTALAIGRARNARAYEIFRDCTASGHWPGYAPDVETIALPRWAEREHEEFTVEY